MLRAFFGRVIDTAINQQLVHNELHGCRVWRQFGIYVDIHLAPNLYAETNL
jgi:hypothetical protein